jgi:hypothetical protein
MELKIYYMGREGHFLLGCASDNLHLMSVLIDFENLEDVDSVFDNVSQSVTDKLHISPEASVPKAFPQNKVLIWEKQEDKHTRVFLIRNGLEKSIQIAIELIY